MSLFHILPTSIRSQHQLQARDMLQSAINWPDDDLQFLRGVITRSSLNRRETGRLAELRNPISETANG